MKRIKIFISFFFFLVLFFLALSDVFAGACLEGDEKYIPCIENPEKKCSDFGYCLTYESPEKAPPLCARVLEASSDKKKILNGLVESLECYPLMMINQSPLMNPAGYLRPRAREHIDFKRKGNLKERQWVEKYIPPLIKNYPELTCLASFQLAIYQYKDVYETMTSKECRDEWFAFWTHLLMTNERSITYFIDYFNEYDQKFRTKTRFAVPHKKVALAGIYLINSKKAVPFLKEQLKNPRNEEIIVDLKKVLDSLEKSEQK